MIWVQQQSSLVSSVSQSQDLSVCQSSGLSESVPGSLCLKGGVPIHRLLLTWSITLRGLPFPPGSGGEAVLM